MMNERTWGSFVVRVHRGGWIFCPIAHTHADTDRLCYENTGVAM